MSEEDDRVFALSMFAPIQISWEAERQELGIRGTMQAGTDEKPFQVQLHGEAAIQSLRAFRRLLDRVDEERVAATKPSDLQ